MTAATVVAQPSGICEATGPGAATVTPGGLGSGDAVQDAIAALLTALGRAVTSGPLAETPQRVAVSLRDLLTPKPIHLTTFANPGGYAGPVVVHDIPFQSLCEHHLMPFRGVAHVGYIPVGRIVGLSTLPKVVEHFSRNLQLQERLTTDIADWLQRELRPAGVGVMIEAEQLCMSLRGAGTPDTYTTTSDFRGAMTRTHFLSPSRLMPASPLTHL